MRWPSVLPGLLAVSGLVDARRSLQHVGRKDLPIDRPPPELPSQQRLLPRQTSPKPKYADDKTAPFAVNGTGIPDVDFDVGESYAGLLSITEDPNADQQLFFWFFPSTNPAADKEIVLWLNGGPGCSSLMGMIQENGPFLWQPGTYRPVANPWSFHRLSNTVWVEQPVGTGFTQGNATIHDEEELAQQFLGFWKNFVELFGLQGYQMYITGESYAGMYCPYIGAAMLDANDTSLYNVSGMLIYDGVIGEITVQTSVVAVPFIDYQRSLMPYNATFSAYLQQTHETCGFADYVAKYLQYPSPAPQPPANFSAECAGLWDTAVQEMGYLNPCFDIYHVSTACPMLWDVMDLASTYAYMPYGTEIYLDRADVKRAIHAPAGANWTECTSKHVFLPDSYADASAPSGQGALPRVVDATRNVIVGHGLLDMVLIANGTLLALQNTTWGGRRGFDRPPTEPLVVPANNLSAPESGGVNRYAALAAAGVMGVAHEERGLTYVSVDLSGHMVPQYAPSVAFRHLEKLLGRIDSLASGAPFTVPINNPPPPAGAQTG